jgi:putative transposase
MNGFAGKRAICYHLPTMKSKFWLTFVTCLAWCIDRELYKAIDYLKEQVRVLVELQEKQDKQIRLNNNQRMRVAAKAKRLSRTLLEQCTVLFTADTVLRWYRDLIARKYDGSGNRMSSGRPPISEEIVHLVIRFKEDNPRWGYNTVSIKISRAF